MNKPRTSFCWECSKKFRRKRGGGVSFVRILGWDGNLHDVHKSCNDGRPVIVE